MEKKPKKERAKKYEPKVAVNTSFEDVIKLAVNLGDKKNQPNKT